MPKDKPVSKNQSYPPGKDIPLSDKEGWTESQMKERSARVVGVKDETNKVISQDYNRQVEMQRKIDDLLK